MANTIKASLVAQLEARGANVTHYQKLINDYDFYDKQEKKAHKDIKKNGTVIHTTSANGKPIVKENPNCKVAIMFNKQKLLILKQMGLTTKNVNAISPPSLEGDDDDKL